MNKRFEKYTDAKTFSKWFTKTGNKCKLEKFLMKTLKEDGE